MNKKYLFPIFLLLCQKTFAQVENSAMADEFKEISKFGTKQTGFEGIQTYSSGIVNGSQFFSPSWSIGAVTTTANETFGKGYFFLFDKLRQELFMKPKDSSVILLVDKNQIKSFMLNTDRDHFFVASAHYNWPEQGIFFEVLTKIDKGFTLLKMTKTKFVKGDERDIEKQSLGEIYDSFIDGVTYYFSQNSGRPQSIGLKEKSIERALEQKNNRANLYFATHNKEHIDEEFLINIFEFINQ
jgi:hypothetical protein